MSYDDVATQLRKYVWIVITLAILIGIIFFMFFSESKTFLDRALSVFRVGF